MAESHEQDGPQLLSNLGILQTAGFHHFKKFPRKQESSAFLAQIILCQHMDKTVSPNQLFSHFVSEPRTNIFVAQKREKTQLRKLFQFLILGKTDLYCWTRYNPTLFRKNDSGNKNLRHWATFMCIRPLLRTDF